MKKFDFRIFCSLATAHIGLVGTVNGLSFRFAKKRKTR